MAISENNLIRFSLSQDLDRPEAPPNVFEESELLLER
jgi:hypothetical protein